MTTRLLATIGLCGALLAACSQETEDKADQAGDAATVAATQAGEVAQSAASDATTSAGTAAVKVGAAADAAGDKAKAAADRIERKADAAANKSLTDNVKLDPQTGRPIVDPQYFKTALDIASCSTGLASVAAAIRARGGLTRAELAARA